MDRPAPVEFDLEVSAGAEDAAISLWLTTHADAVGRRRVLRIGAALMAGAGIVFSLSGNFWILLVAATIGVILASREGDTRPASAAQTRTSIGLALVAALGFGSFFVGLRISARADVLWALLAGRATDSRRASGWR